MGYSYDSTKIIELKERVFNVMSLIRGVRNWEYQEKPEENIKGCLNDNIEVLIKKYTRIIEEECFHCNFVDQRHETKYELEVCREGNLLLRNRLVYACNSYSWGWAAQEADENRLKEPISKFFEKIKKAKRQEKAI